jgi:hypothetical protein
MVLASLYGVSDLYSIMHDYQMEYGFERWYAVDAINMILIMMRVLVI